MRLRSLLAARGIAVVTTRESDADLDADRRAEIANHANAQACLSLHASESGSGVHIFVSSLAPAEGSAFVPWKTAQAAWVTRSLALAGVLNCALQPRRHDGDPGPHRAARDRQHGLPGGGRRSCARSGRGKRQAGRA